MAMATDNIHGQARPAAQAGRFYEHDAAALRAEVADCYGKGGQQSGRDDVAALIAPHAGYYFSGEVAAAAFSQLNPKHRYGHIFLIGPSHRVWIGGASTETEYAYYTTPLGKVKVDTALCRDLTLSDSVFGYRPEAHEGEHCLEVQLPFLQMRLENLPPIVPIIISTDDITQLRKIAAVLKPYFTEENLFIVSSDFSHYPPYEEACRIDRRTRDAIMSGKLQTFVDTLESNKRLGSSALATSACGESAIATLLLMLDDHYRLHHLMYRNSGDKEHYDRSRVVGYHAFAVTREKAFYLTEDEKQALRSIARKSIERAFDGRDYGDEQTDTLTETLKKLCGAFVTLKADGRLRGCIGHIGDDTPLYATVSEMARAAAFGDPRFPPLQRGELKDIHIEISVLTPMKRIYSLDEFELGRHGILIRKGAQSGTYLPQVANEVNWTKEEYVGHCSQYKAGLGPDGWMDAELYTYEAIVF
jgi:AmmeMemoRadiSam system protein B/AmmeMemoRadiSam system protein A